LVVPLYTKGIPGLYRRTVVKVPANGRSPAGELTRRDPQLFATSAMAAVAEAHSHIAPP
jgi:hypothetical protein